MSVDDRRRAVEAGRERWGKARIVRRNDFSPSGMTQSLWFDRDGDSLVITSGPEGEVAFLRQSGGYRMIPNFIVIDPSYGMYPCWRQDTVKMILRRIAHGAREASIATFLSILQYVYQPHAATCSNIFDLTSLTAYFHRHCD